MAQAKGAIALIASLTFVAGILCGLAIGGRRVAEVSPAERESGSLAPPLEASRPLENQGAPAAGAGPALKPDQVAQELWDMIMRSRSPADRDTGLRKLRPEMAEFFIRKYREAATATDSSQQMAMEMAIACGGPKAVEFLEELIRVPVDIHNKFRYRTVITSVLSTGHIAPRPREFAVSDSLLNRTQVLLSSDELEDRRLATAILGHVGASQALPILTSLTRSDPSPYVRHTAIRELGRIGDAGTLEQLRSGRDALISEMYRLEMESLQSVQRRGPGPAIVSSRNSHSRVVDDAIEELEERLSPK